jgi:hypothetical protein
VVIQEHAVDQQAQQLLPIGSRGGWRRPHAGRVLGQRKDLLAIIVAQDDLLSATPARVLTLELLERAQSVFPLRLQCSRDEPILRFDHVVLATCAFRLIACSFQSQLPLPVQRCIFALDLGHGGDGNRNGIRRQCAQHDALNLVIQVECAYLLAAQRAAPRSTLEALVDRELAAGGRCWGMAFGGSAMAVVWG